MGYGRGERPKGKTTKNRVASTHGKRKVLEGSEWGLRAAVPDTVKGTRDR